MKSVRWFHVRRVFPSAMWPYAALVLVVLVYFAPFFFQGKHVVPFHFEPGSVTGIPWGGAGNPRIPFHRQDSSPVSLHYPNAVLTAESLRHGKLPLWNPYAGFGEPALANGSVYPFSPFLWPFYLIPNPWIFTLGIALGVLWGGFGFYLWLGKMSLGTWERILGAALWAFNPWSVRMFIYSNVWGAWWLGWVFWSWDLAMERDGSWWPAALFMTGAVYGGHPEIALMIAGAGALYGLAPMEPGPTLSRRPFPARFVVVVCAGALTIFLTAVHWWPVLARATEAVTYKELEPGFLLRNHLTFASIFNPRSDVYLSPAVLGLALVGTWAGVRGRFRRLLFCVAMIGASAVFGFQLLPPSWMPFARIIPGIYATTFLWAGLVPVIVVGLGNLRGWDFRGSRRANLLLLGGAVAVYALFFLQDAAEGGAVCRLIRPDWVELYGGLLLLLGMLPLMAGGRQGRLVLVLVAVVLVFDPFVLWAGRIRADTPFALDWSERGSASSYFNRLDPTAGGPPGLVPLKARLEEDHGRFWAPSLPRELGGDPALTPDLAQVWRIHDARVVDVLLSRRVFLLQSLVEKGHPLRYLTWMTFPDATASWLARLGVQWVAVPQGINSGQFKVERVEGALPRARIAHHVLGAADEAGSLKEVQESLTRDRSVVLEGWSGPEEVGSPGTNDRVEWVQDALDEVRLRATSPGGGLLVLMDTMADGWTSSVDGHPAKIYPADLAFRAVVLPPGTHDVAFRYAPVSVAAGLALSTVGWTGVAILIVWSLRRRKSRLGQAGGGRK